MKRVAFKLLDRGEKHGTGGQEQPTAVLGQVPIEPGILNGLLQEALLFGRLRTGEVCVRGLPPAAFAPFEAHGLHVNTAFMLCQVPGGLFGLGLKRVEGFSSLIMGTIPLRIVKTSHAAAAAARLAQGRGVTDCMP